MVKERCIMYKHVQLVYDHGSWCDYDCAWKMEIVVFMLYGALIEFITI